MNSKAPVLNTRPSACAALVAVCAILSAPVQAKDQDIIVGYRVTTQGLDLSQPSGAHEFYSRLQHAAEVVCTHGMRMDLLPSPDPKGCYERALGNAVRSANLPLLTQVYLETHSLREAAAQGIDVPVQMAAK
jgi:UrcA family protein